MTKTKTKTRYRNLRLTFGVHGGTRDYQLHPDDQVTKVEGGIEVRWHSSPRVTTFYPYHRVWELEEIDAPTE